MIENNLTKTSLMIAVVEDDLDIQELIAMHLARAGYNLMAFAKGEDAIQFALDNPVDLFLLDVMLEGESGFKILEKIRALPSTKNIPVIMLTSRSSEIDQLHGLKIGADDYITKPFRPKLLLARVEARLRSAKPRETLAPEKASYLGIELDTLTRRLSYGPR